MAPLATIKAALAGGPPEALAALATVERMTRRARLDLEEIHAVDLDDDAIFRVRDAHESLSTLTAKEE